MLATYAASRHRQIVPCCMISSVSHDNVSRLVTDRSMCFATALDKAFENIDCMSAILRCQAKNRFYESTQRLIQPRRVLCCSPFSKLRSRAKKARRQKVIVPLQIAAQFLRTLHSQQRPCPPLSHSSPQASARLVCSPGAGSGRHLLSQ